MVTDCFLLFCITVAAVSCSTVNPFQNYTILTECSQMNNPVYFADTIISFHSNLLVSIPSYAFHNFPNAESIDLHGNKIRNGK